MAHSPNELATRICYYGAAYADMELEDQPAPGDHVVGNEVRFIWPLVWLAFPVALSRNCPVPPAGGTSRAIQYFPVAAMSVAGISAVFHAPLRGALMLAWASRMPGALFAVFV